MSLRAKAAFASIAITLLMSACGPAEQTEPAAAADNAVVDTAAIALEIAQNSIIIDTHIDVPYRIEEVAISTILAQSPAASMHHSCLFTLRQGLKPRGDPKKWPKS